MVPLPVRLFVEQAVRLIQDNKSLSDLPVSLPDIYFRHLRQINPSDSSTENFLGVDRMIRVAKILAKLAIAKDYVPKGFLRSEAVAKLEMAGEPVNMSVDPIIRLQMNGVLLEKVGGIDIHLRFALDPIAEFLAAALFAEDCGADADKWDAIFAESSQSSWISSRLKAHSTSLWAAQRVGSTTSKLKSRSIPLFS